MNKWFLKLNKTQREKTADLILDVTKGLMLAVLIGLLLPDVTKRLRLTETVIAVILSAFLFRLSLKLYRK